MNTKQCPTCGKEIEYRSKLCWDCFQATKNKKYCVDCGQKINTKWKRCWECHAKHIAVPERFCADCNIKLPKYGNTVRCKKCLLKRISDSATNWYCIDCGIPVTRRTKRCKTCDEKNRAGKATYIRTEAHNLNMKQKMTGRSVEWRKGKPHKPETRQKMREHWTEEKRKEAGKRWKGENNPGYVHGQRSRPWPYEFNSRLKTKIKKRDGYICQECKQPLMPRSRMTDIHHIDYDKHNNDSANLITLCRSCHAKTNFNRDYWRNHFEQMQVQRAHN